MLNNGTFQAMVYAQVVNESINDRSVFYRLSESEIFNMATDKTTYKGKKLTEVLPMMINEDDGFIHVGIENINKELLYEIFESSQYNINCKKNIKNLIVDGKIILVYTEEYKLPTAIPYVIKIGNESGTVYVNISDFVNMDKHGMIDITNKRNMNGFMAILFAAAFTYNIVFSKSMNTLPSAADGLFLMHGNMMSKVISSISHLDPITKDKIRYLCTQFSLIQSYGTNEGLKIFHRMRDKNFPLSQLVMDALDNNFKIDNYDNISLFIDGLHEMYPITKNMNLSVFFEKWVKMYGSSTAMAIDYIGYQIYIFSMLMFESSFVSRLAVESAINPIVATGVYKYIQNTIAQ